MSFLYPRGAVLAAMLTLPGLTFADIIIADPYARVSRPNAETGAAFMHIENTAQTDDRLLAARSDVAKRVELHTHVDQGNGVMKMVELDEGIPIAAGSTHVLQRGGDHVMFMGLFEPMKQGTTVEVVLSFETAGDVAISIPVDNERKPQHGDMGGGHTTEGATE